jgi:hypothetical protein
LSFVQVSTSSDGRAFFICLQGAAREAGLISQGVGFPADAGEVWKVTQVGCLS